MKSLLLSLLALVAVCLAAPTSATGSTSGGGGTTTTTVAAKGSVVTEKKKDVADPVPARKTVKPGKCHKNNDGVEVCNTGEKGNFVVDPKSGNENSATTVEAKNDAEGTVEGIDSNDTVNLASGSNVTISGTGGTVNAGSGSTGTVQNTNAPGGASITVNIGGGNFSVPPGVTIPFNG